jgi:hypothetical protein
MPLMSDAGLDVSLFSSVFVLGFVSHRANLAPGGRFCPIMEPIWENKFMAYKSYFQICKLLH